MKEPRPRRFSVFELLCGLSLLVALGFLVMWPLGHRYYTSVGFDVERAEGEVIVQTHYRIRWPGDGSFLMGRDAFRRPGPGPVDRFDLGGAFFKAPRIPPQRSPWNRWGFWFIRLEDAVPSVTSAEPLWLGVPGWLPALLAGLLPLRWVVRRRTLPRLASGRTGTNA
jgi:hypothetical protein